MRKIAALATIALSLALTGCSGSEEVVTEPAVEEVFTPVDQTQAVKEAAGAHADLITSATQTEESRMEIATTIVDPRGDEGSSEALEAIAVCEAGIAVLGEGTSVSVLEEDGTSFVLAGHPAYGPDCTEV